MTGISSLDPPGTPHERALAIEALPKVIAPPRSAIWPLVITVYATLLPSEIRFDLGDQTFYPPRFVLAILLPWMIREIAAGRFRVRPTDWAVVALGTWMVVSFMVYYGFANGFFRGMGVAFDATAGYLMARLCIRSVTDLRRVLIACAPGFAVVAASIVTESFVGRPIVRPFATSIFGGLRNNVTGENSTAVQYIDQYRFGLLRSAGPFGHPILGGIYLVSLFPLYATSRIHGWPRALGIFASFAAIFSVSSAAALMLGVLVALFAFEFFQSRTSLLNWPTAITGAAIFALMIQIAADQGLIPFLLRYSLDPGTAFYRLLIWEYGTASVAQHPWIGIGYTNYEQPAWMGESLDNQWLLLAVRHGVPGAFLAILAVVLALVDGARAVTLSSFRDRLFTVMVVASYFAFVIAGITVAFFGSIPTWFGILQASVVGIGAFAVDPRSTAPSPVANAR